MAYFDPTAMHFISQAVHFLSIHSISFTITYGENFKNINILINVDLNLFAFDSCETTVYECIEVYFIPNYHWCNMWHSFGQLNVWEIPSDLVTHVCTCIYLSTYSCIDMYTQRYRFCTYVWVYICIHVLSIIYLSSYIISIIYILWEKIYCVQLLTFLLLSLS